MPLVKTPPAEANNFKSLRQKVTVSTESLKMPLVKTPPAESLKNFSFGQKLLPL